MTPSTSAGWRFSAERMVITASRGHAQITRDSSTTL
jgi:hypothetical protein